MSELKREKKAFRYSYIERTNKQYNNEMRTDAEARVIAKLIDLIADDADFEQDETGIYFPGADLTWNCYTWGDINYDGEIVFVTVEEQQDIYKLIQKRVEGI